MERERSGSFTPETMESDQRCNNARDLKVDKLIEAFGLSGQFRGGRSGQDERRRA
jgi:hypothetical protein